MGVKKLHVARRGKISFSEGGGNIFLGPKYRPLRRANTYGIMGRGKNVVQVGGGGIWVFWINIKTSAIMEKKCLKG
jgi:hypothetical protein